MALKTKKFRSDVGRDLAVASMPGSHTTTLRTANSTQAVRVAEVARLATASSSHRRHLALHSDVHARGGQAAISLLLRHHEHPGTGLELALVDRCICHHDRVLGDENLLLSALVLHGHHAVVRHADDVGDTRVGHLAVGLEIPIDRKSTRLNSSH